MINSSPITPPPELMMKWQEDWHHSKANYIEIEVYMATKAARWGADQELEACVEWLEDADLDDSQKVSWVNLRAARRPKSPSLKEQALALLDKAEDPRWDIEDFSIVRKALEALPND